MGTKWEFWMICVSVPNKSEVWANEHSKDLITTRGMPIKPELGRFSRREIAARCAFGLFDIAGVIAWSDRASRLLVAGSVARGQSPEQRAVFVVANVGRCGTRECPAVAR
jgi:hypothetical protein